ncbi:MAG: hypothetical protein QME35_05635 [Thermoanaerobacteraceae bacterium]|nr:hypothetical protein [Thermoanaerobacteraceae bacterium]
MKLNIKKIGNLIIGTTNFDEENVDEIIDLLFEKYGRDFFCNVYQNFKNGDKIDESFKKTLMKEDKLKKLKIMI